MESVVAKQREGGREGGEHDEILTPDTPIMQRGERG